MVKQLKLKLAKMLSKFAEITTDKGVLLSDGELVVGTEVYLIDSDGEYITAPDGEYKLDNVIYVVLDGMIAEIKELSVETLEGETIEEVVTESVDEAVEEAVDEVITPLIEDVLALIEAMDLRITALEEQNVVVTEEVVEFKKLVSKLSSGKPVEDQLKNDTKSKSRIENLTKALSNIRK